MKKRVSFKNVVLLALSIVFGLLALMTVVGLIVDPIPVDVDAAQEWFSVISIAVTCFLFALLGVTTARANNWKRLRTLVMLAMASLAVTILAGHLYANAMLS